MTSGKGVGREGPRGKVRVEPNDWGGARIVDIERLLTDAASHINRELRQIDTEIVNVRLAPSTDFTPRHLIQCYRPGSSTVQITATGTFWSQYVYQFIHEFCHVIIEPIQPSSGPNHWFEEAICEASSLFTLRRMAERWKTDPPYENWASYSSALAEYAHGRLSAPQRALPSTMSLPEWLAEHEDALRSDPYGRDRNAVVGYQLLPILEARPGAWNAVQRLPAGQHAATNSPTCDYLRSWRSVVDPRDRHVVDQVMQLLGVS